MSRTINISSLLSVKAKQLLQQETQLLPKYSCATCTKKTAEDRCTCFQRPVDVNYNKCFYHSKYSPIQGAFRCPENIEEIARQNEEKMYA